MRGSAFTVVNDQSRIELQRGYAGLAEDHDVLVYPACFRDVPRPEDRAMVRQRWGVPASGLAVVCSGHFSRMAGAEWLITALQSVASMHLVLEPLVLDEFVRFMLQMASALEHAHQRGVVAQRAEVADIVSKVETLRDCDTDPAKPACKVSYRFIIQVSRNTPIEDVFVQTAFAAALIRAEPRVVALNFVQTEDNQIARRDYTRHMRIVAFLAKDGKTLWAFHDRIATDEGSNDDVRSHSRRFQDGHRQHPRVVPVQRQQRGAGAGHDTALHHDPSGARMRSTGGAQLQALRDCTGSPALPRL
jgi:hypothetical protein